MSIDPKSNYYMAGGIESMAIAQAKLTEEQFQGALLFNVMKYATRCNFKGSFERDVEKIRVYANLLNEAVNGKPEEESEEDQDTKELHAKALLVALKAQRTYLEAHNGKDQMQGVREDTQA